jgi:hypothetical protein
MLIFKTKPKINKITPRTVMVVPPSHQVLRLENSSKRRAQVALS